MNPFSKLGLKPWLVS
jgi:ATP-dependent RNA helicase DDX49/DBP8